MIKSWECMLVLCDSGVCIHGQIAHTKNYNVPTASFDTGPVSELMVSASWQLDFMTASYCQDIHHSQI